MKETLVVLETAVLAKYKGFDWLCNNYTSRRDGDFFSSDINLISYKNWNEIINTYSRPTQTLIQKWLREVHDILVYVDPKSHHIFQYHIITSDNEIIGSERTSNWEQVLEKGLQKSLLLIKL